MTYCLEFEAVVEINRKYTDNGGALRDSAALHSSLARPLQGGFGRPEFYPTVAEKAAVLLHGVTCSHAFVDGNKRTGWVCCVTFLRLQGVLLKDHVDDEADDFVLDVVEGRISIPEAALWLLDRTR